MITRKFLEEQIEVLQNLELDAETSVKEYRSELICAKANFRNAEKHLTELMAVRTELEWQLAHFHGGKAEQAKQ